MASDLKRAFFPVCHTCWISDNVRGLEKTLKILFDLPERVPVELKNTVICAAMPLLVEVLLLLPCKEYFLAPFCGDYRFRFLCCVRQRVYVAFCPLVIIGVVTRQMPALLGFSKLVQLNSAHSLQVCLHDFYLTPGRYSAHHDGGFT